MEKKNVLFSVCNRQPCAFINEPVAGDTNKTLVLLVTAMKVLELGLAQMPQQTRESPEQIPAFTWSVRSARVWLDNGPAVGRAVRLQLCSFELCLKTSLRPPKSPPVLPTLRTVIPLERKSARFLLPSITHGI